MGDTVDRTFHTPQPTQSGTYSGLPNNRKTMFMLLL